MDTPSNPPTRPRQAPTCPKDLPFVPLPSASSSVRLVALNSSEFYSLRRVHLPLEE